MAGGARTELASHQVVATDDKGIVLTNRLAQVVMPSLDSQWLSPNLTGIRGYRGETQLQDTYRFTLLLSSPAPNAKTLNLELFSYEVIPTGKQQSMTLRDIPLP
jgi:hypothetical protein